MKRIFCRLMSFAFSVFVLSASSFANADDYIVNKEQYFSELGANCSIQAKGTGVISISVSCSSDGRNKGYGNCSGNKWDGDFSCQTGSGSRAYVIGGSKAINWILNNL